MTGSNYPKFGSTTVQVKPTKIHDYTVDNYIGISLWTQQALDAITENTGNLASANEYQVHYWSLNMRKVFPDGSLLDISVPTVFFNYKQQVTAASIDFELSEVEQVSDDIYVLHNIEVNKLKPLLDEHFPDFVFTSVGLNSLHKHPGGRSQSFSGTDLKKDHTNDTGIVFPLASADVRPNFASIICYTGGSTYLAHTEYRIADGSVPSDKGISYYNGRTASYVKAPMSELSDAEKLFGYKEKDTSYTVTDDLDNSQFLSSITAIWDTISYEPHTDFISSDNVTEKVYKYTAPKATQKSDNRLLGSYKETSPGKYSLVSALDTYTDAYDQIAVKALEDEQIFILSLSVLNAMTPKMLTEHNDALEAYHYGWTEGEFGYFSGMYDVTTTVDEVLDLQQEIVDSYFLE